MFSLLYLPDVGYFLFRFYTLSDTFYLVLSLFMWFPIGLLFPLLAYSTFRLPCTLLGNSILSYYYYWISTLVAILIV